ncbi:hypothetical protein ACFFX1_54485 [Dactylosporangium sucinum]|uniref:Uncharacterized protein n=1 Tax=Dactylosporangium sucinum TaxID=1424081 RepID=A0A917X6N1_9ACTN|nr:hypothetical protein [Dactylosporangium sucinum]GGM87443.1 hypothetical protein GCM10007977_106770 [Dactylosporangium sucinum]
MQESWPHTLADGFVGAFLGSILSVLVALYAIRRAQRTDRENRREELSLAAAERLTEALLETLRRLNQLADHTVARTRASRAEATSALASELETAVDLHAPVLLPAAFAELPERTHTLLERFLPAIEERERAVMRQEGLAETDEDRAFAVDRQAADLRKVLIGFLRDTIETLTAYRRGQPLAAGALPAVPVLPVAPGRAATPRQR